jgi:CRP/FNR family transcriptional regulator, cyclic AMP receptor protein
MTSMLRRPAVPGPCSTLDPGGPRFLGTGLHFWPELAKPDRVALLQLGSISTFRPGSVLVRERDVPCRVMVILTGCVKVLSTDADDRQTVLDIRDAGDTIGETCGMSGRPSSASVQALRNVEALGVPAERFTAFVRSNLNAATALQGSLCARLLGADRLRRAAMTESVERRLATVLLDLAERYGAPHRLGGVLIDLPLSHGDLAGLATTSRRTLDRALNRLRAEGVVATGRRTVVISDPAQLKALAA